MNFATDWLHTFYTIKNKMPVLPAPYEFPLKRSIHSELNIPTIHPVYNLIIEVSDGKRREKIEHGRYAMDFLFQELVELYQTSPITIKSCFFSKELIKKVSKSMDRIICWVGYNKNNNKKYTAYIVKT